MSIDSNLQTANWLIKFYFISVTDGYLLLVVAVVVVFQTGVLSTVMLHVLHAVLRRLYKQTNKVIF